MRGGRRGLSSASLFFISQLERETSSSVDGAVHPIGIEAAGVRAAPVDDFQNLRGCAGDAKRVAVDVVRHFGDRGNVERIDGRAVDAVHDAGQTNGARVLRLRAQNGGGRSEVGAAANVRRRTEVGA